MNPITLPVAELKPALAGLSKIIPKRPTLPVLGCVRITRTREGRIELTGTDLEQTATVQLTTPDQGEPTTILVPIDDLANVVKSAGRTDALVLTRVEKDKAAIRFPVAGNILEHRCESLPVAEFPEVEEVSGQTVVLPTTVRHAIHEALACASTDETRLILNGAYLDVSKPGAHYVVGTDGRHLFSSNSFTLALRESIIIPSHAFIGWRGFNDDGDWRIRVKPATKDTAQVLELESGGWRYTCRSHDGNYPNWRQVVPADRDYTCCVEVGPECLESLIQTVTRLPDHDPLYHAIGIETQGCRVQLLAQSERGQPWAPVEATGAKSTGKDVKIFVNRLLLLKALRFGLTRIDLIDGMSPIRLSAGGRQMIISPVRIDAALAEKAETTTPGPTPAEAKTNPPPLQRNNQRRKTACPKPTG